MTTQIDINSASKAKIDALRSVINARLRVMAAGSEFAPRLNAAIAHSLLAPGKRFRPILCVLIAREFSANTDAALDAGCAAEMVHTASLILDDLPCMDDAKLRRGLPTTHLEFDESTAILAAVALLNRAYGIIAKITDLDASSKVDLTELLSRAVGSYGLIAGQIADLDNDDMDTDESHVEQVNALKTGALFDYTILAAAKIGKLTAAQTEHAAEFSRQIGLAFQLLDDLKDRVLSEAQAGKTIDRDIGKATLVALGGEAAAKQKLADYMKAADDALIAMGVNEVSPLRNAIAYQFKLPSHA